MGDISDVMEWHPIWSFTYEGVAGPLGLVYSGSCISNNTIEKLEEHRVNPTEAEKNRLGFIDAFRGVLMVHMALDHASMYFNSGRWAHEWAWQHPGAPDDLIQFLTRFTGVFVAPGFFFVAGFMVALTSAWAEARGTASWLTTKRLLIRGLVLIGFDYLLISLPEHGFRFLFAVLSCLGICLIVVTLLRRLPTWIVLALSSSIVLLHPLFAVTGLPRPAAMLLYEGGFDMARGFGVIYPVLPWLGVMLAGLATGELFLRNKAGAERGWFILAAVFFGLFFVVRSLGGTYGNAYELQGLAGVEYWIFAKYPPDLAWLSWSAWQIFLGLGLLRIIEGRDLIRWLEPLMVYGRVPFFFFIVHICIMIPFTFVLPPGSLAVTYLIWLVLLAVLWAPCRWYSRMKVERPNLVTRYV